LRERKADITVLANHFLERFSSEIKKHFTGIHPAALERLVAYDWPGNVRELANVLERAIVLGEEPEIALHDLPSRIIDAQSAPQPEGASYRKAVDAYRRSLIAKALEHANGNRAAAAKALGLHRTHLLRLLKLLRIDG
jgi:DNA-binding NtrC family response regulator